VIVSVISGNKIIFCEGEPYSLDYLLLNRLLETIKVPFITVSVGGKFSFSTFARGYFSKKRERQKEEHQNYIVSRDRDFDAIPTQDVHLLKLDTRLGNKNVFLTHKACIENYLIDDTLIHEYWAEKYTEKQEKPASKWGHGDSPGLEAISKWIQNSAEKIKDYQVIRWALSDLIRESNIHSRLKTTWTDSSGNLPDSLLIEDCLLQGINLIR
jgi:hypothetical protein